MVYCPIAQKKYRSTLKGKMKAKKDHKLYKERHPERVANQLKNWRTNNKKQINITRNKYLLIKGNRIKAIIRSSTWAKHGPAKICSSCNSKIKVEHHHPEPYNIDNFLDLCKNCHTKLRLKK